jgi:hypothetical protein
VHRLRLLIFIVWQAAGRGHRRRVSAKSKPG